MWYAGSALPSAKSVFMRHRASDPAFLTLMNRAILGFWLWGNPDPGISGEVSA